MRYHNTKAGVKSIKNVAAAFRARPTRPHSPVVAPVAADEVVADDTFGLGDRGCLAGTARPPDIVASKGPVLREPSWAREVGRIRMAVSPLNRHPGTAWPARGGGCQIGPWVAYAVNRHG